MENEEINEFYNFMTDLDYKKESGRCRNALIRGGIKSIKEFAETPPENFLKIRNVGFSSMKYIMYKHAQARELFKLDPVLIDEDKAYEYYHDKLFNNKVKTRYYENTCRYLVERQTLKSNS